MSTRVSRRHFLYGAAAAPLILSARAKGANDRIGVGFIGNGSMNSYHCKQFSNRPDCQVTGVCDVNRLKRKELRRLVEERYAQAAGQASYTGVADYNDFRELVDAPDVDAVFVATPEHWHVLPALAAVRAGKDVYVEKPMSLTIEEGRVLADEVKRTGQVFQHGAMQRSRYDFGRAVELVRNGRVGRLHTVEVGLANAVIAQNDQCVGGPVPEYLDYEMWLGPAPFTPYCENVCLGVRAWTGIEVYSGGRITEWGSHHLDIAQWGLDADDAGPLTLEGEAEFTPEGGMRHFVMKWRMEMQYPGGVKLVFADDTQIGDNYEGGVKFIGDEGWIYVTREYIKAEPESILTSELGPDAVRVWTSKDHHQNFVDCIRSREETIGPAEASHRSTTVCHLANICFRLGRKVTWDAKTERFVNDDEANGMIARPMRAPWSLHV